jgi:sulfate-transporting ATPase
LDRAEGIPFEGNYSAWLENKQKRLAQEQKQKTAKDKQMDQELEWIRQSPKARQSKSKARIQAYEALLREDGKNDIQDGTIFIPTSERLGDVVIDANHVSKSYGDRVLIDDLSFSLPKGGIVGIIGPNGAGKSTLVKILTGQVQPDQGTLKVGDTVHMAYVDQSRDDLHDNWNVWEEISDKHDVIPLGKKEVPSRAYVSWFGFKGSDQQKKMNMLSGGERNRVHLAKILKSGGNVLFLDEPTNDLDVETLRSLEEALLQFAGCCVVVSHDRFFLDRIATHIMAFEGEGKVVFFEGNYQSYEDDYHKRCGFEIKPFKYKPLAR